MAASLPLPATKGLLESIILRKCQLLAALPGHNDSTEEPLALLLGVSCRLVLHEHQEHRRLPSPGIWNIPRKFSEKSLQVSKKRPEMTHQNLRDKIQQVYNTEKCNINLSFFRRIELINYISVKRNKRHYIF